jgi:hypothetical protein
MSHIQAKVGMNHSKRWPTHMRYHADKYTMLSFIASIYAAVMGIRHAKNKSRGRKQAKIEMIPMLRLAAS